MTNDLDAGLHGDAPFEDPQVPGAGDRCRRAGDTTRKGSHLQRAGPRLRFASAKGAERTEPLPTEERVWLLRCRTGGAHADVNELVLVEQLEKGRKGLRPDCRREFEVTGRVVAIAALQDVTLVALRERQLEEEANARLEVIATEGEEARGTGPLEPKVLGIVGKVLAKRFEVIPSRTSSVPV